MPVTPPARLSADDSALLVIDVQDKLLVKIPNAAGLVRDVGFLLDAAALVGVPAFATEQYPQGLGPTTAELARRLPTGPPTKVSFSCCGVPETLAGLFASARPNVVVAGMETHVCVMQTALDLLAQGLRVFVPVDAVSARFRLDHEVALRRMEQAGAVLTSTEAVGFEWVGASSHPQFKAFSRLVQDRARQGAECGIRNAE